VAGNSGDVLGSRVLYLPRQQSHESPDCWRFNRGIGEEGELAVVRLEEEKDRRHALRHLVLSLLFRELVALGQGGKLPGIVEQQLEPELAVGRCEALDGPVKIRHARILLGSGSTHMLSTMAAPNS